MGTIFPNEETGDAVKATFLSHRGSLHPLELLWNILQIWADRSRQRRALARLNTDQLRDIGVNHYEAAREAAKPFWRP
jgi:uncharacterized protein YjiS (DUF1127 family)